MTRSILKNTIVLAILSTVFIQCTSIIPAESKLMRESEAVNISAYELRDRLNVFAIRFSNSVERAADKIIGNSDDPKIRENALLWKMNSIPAANQAIFLSDPMAALIDISALVVQMNYFFSHGKGKDLFGKYQSLAIQATEELKQNVLEIWGHTYGQVIIDSLKIVTNPITEWAKRYPIEDISFLRRSVSDTLFSSLDGGDLGFQETVGSIAVSAYDIRERLTIYADQMPKLARWQAEYLLNKTLDNNQMKRSFENFERITNSIDSITKIIEQSPELANRLQYRTMAQLTSERMAILDALTRERIAVMEEIQRQRVATLDAVEKFTQEMLSATENRAENLIDHMYWRLFQILILIYVVFLVTFIVLRKIYWPMKNIH